MGVKQNNRLRNYSFLSYNLRMPGLTWSDSALSHANRCTDNKCGTPECPQARRLFYHHHHCKAKAECQLCSRLRQLAGPHAAECKLQRCKFPYCRSIRHNRREKQEGEKEDG